METPLKNIRTRMKKTIYEVADGVGCTAATISRIEGGGNCSPDLAEKIANYFGRKITEEKILYPARFMKKAA